MGELFKDVLNLYIETKTRKIVVRLEGKRIFYRVLLYVDSKSDDQKEIDTKMKIGIEFKFNRQNNNKITIGSREPFEWTQHTPKVRTRHQTSGVLRNPIYENIFKKTKKENTRTQKYKNRNGTSSIRFLVFTAWLFLFFKGFRIHPHDVGDRLPLSGVTE